MHNGKRLLELSFCRLSRARKQTRLAFPAARRNLTMLCWQRLLPALGSHAYCAFAATCHLTCSVMLQAVKGEEANMIIIPRWEEESNDVVLAALTASLLDGIRNIRDFQSRDMRQHSRAVMEAMPQHINKLRARAQQDDIEIDLTSESSVECEEMMKEVHIESRQAELASV